MPTRSLKHVVFSAVLSCTWITSLQAETLVPKTAEHPVIQALQLGTAGHLDQRDAALEKLIGERDVGPVAKSLQGFIQNGQDWGHVQQWVDREVSNPVLELYVDRRSDLADTLANHLALARWCARHKLPDQTRAHLEHILRFDPNNAAIRRVLGYVRSDGDWLSPAEQGRADRIRVEAERSVNQYGSRLASIAQRVAVDSKATQRYALSELDRLRQANAIPAIEMMAWSYSHMGPHAIAWLSDRDEVSASKSLLRLALSHADESIRSSAIEALIARPVHDFVPDALVLLSSEVRGAYLPLFDDLGRINGVRKVFARESEGAYNLQVVNQQGRNRPQNFRRFGPGTNTRTLAFAAEEALVELRNAYIAIGIELSVRSEIQASYAAVSQQNALVNHRNQRISTILGQVAKRDFAGDVTQMWDWWDDVNETDYQKAKSVLRDRRNIYDERVGYERSPRDVSYECFSAGTQVLTERGMKSIESVVVADRVLTRDLHSARLVWKPVLRATQRPKERTLTIKVGKDQLRTTPGHLYWISGSGWKKASEICVGDRLHAAGSPALVQAVEDSPAVETYNLLVADNFNYFVGNSLILSHDVSKRRDERQAYPGQLVVRHLNPVR